MLNRRQLLAGSGATFALAACGRGDAGALRVGSQKGGTKALMTAAGALDGAPYHVEWSEFPAAQNLLEALGSGAVDVGLIGDAPYQFAYQSGSPIKAVAAMRTQTLKPGALAIVVNGNSPVHDLAGLIGRKVATTHGSIGHYLVLHALEATGHPPDSIHLSFLSPSDSRAALQTGAVDGWSTWVPYTVAAVVGGARIVVDGRDFSNATAFDVANATSAVTKRKLLADFLAREAKALEWAQDHLDVYAAALSKETGLPLPIARGTVEVSGRLRTPINSGLIAEQQVIVDTFRKSGDIKAPRSIQPAFDPI